MKKISLLLGAFLLFMSLTSKAQFKVIASGPGFQESEKGFAKILQLKNGYTLFIQSEKMKNYRIKIYNSEHKEIVTNNLETPKIAPLGGCDVAAIFETNGQIAMFVSGYSKLTPVLFRYIITPEDGKVISETEIARQDKVKDGLMVPYFWGDVPFQTFLVIKDDYSENYALGYVHSYGPKDNDRVNVVHYNNRHEEISKSYFVAPSDKFKHARIRHLCVIGDKEVAALLYTTNAEKSQGKESSVLLASFSNNNPDVKYNELDIPEGYVLGRAVMRYNPTTKKINVASLFQVDKKILKQLEIEQGDIRNCMMFHEITPVTMDVKKGPLLNPEAANKLFNDLFAAKLMFGKKIPYQGLFQNMYVNMDGSTTLIFEGYDILNSQTIGQNSHSTSDTYLSDIIVINITKDGLSQNSVLIPKQHRIEKSAISGGGNYSTNQYMRTTTFSPFAAGNQFKYFTYIPGKTKNYILFNDIMDNEEKVRQGKRTIIQGIGGSDAFSFITNENETMPTRNYLLGAPPEREHQVALLGISDYEATTNTYVTLKLELDGRDKKVRLVWLQPE